MIVIIYSNVQLSSVLSPPPLSISCDDSNECTLDYLHSDGYCCHELQPNNVPCTSPSYTSATCNNGECIGDCISDCNHWTDCPRLNTLNITTFDAFNTSEDSMELVTMCGFQGCFYRLNLHIDQADGIFGIGSNLWTLTGTGFEVVTNFTSLWAFTTSASWRLDALWPFDDPLGQLCSLFIHEKELIRSSLSKIETVIDDVTIECLYALKCTSLVDTPGGWITR